MNTQDSSTQDESTIQQMIQSTLFNVKPLESPPRNPVHRPRLSKRIVIDAEHMQKSSSKTSLPTSRAVARPKGLSSANESFAVPLIKNSALQKNASNSSLLNISNQTLERTSTFTRNESPYQSQMKRSKDESTSVQPPPFKNSNTNLKRAIKKYSNTLVVPITTNRLLPTTVNNLPTFATVDNTVNPTSASTKELLLRTPIRDHSSNSKLFSQNSAVPLQQPPSLVRNAIVLKATSFKGPDMLKDQRSVDIRKVLDKMESKKSYSSKGLAEFHSSKILQNAGAFGSKIPNPNGLKRERTVDLYESYFEKKGDAPKSDNESRKNKESSVSRTGKKSSTRTKSNRGDIKRDSSQNYSEGLEKSGLQILRGPSNRNMTKLESLRGPLKY